MGGGQSHPLPVKDNRPDSPKKSNKQKYSYITSQLSATTEALPRLILLGGRQCVITQDASFEMGGKSWTVKEASSTMLVLTFSRSKENEDVCFFEAKVKVREELSQLRLDINQLEGNKKGILQRMENETEDAYKLASELGPLAAKIGHLKKKIRELEGLRSVAFSCMKENEILELPAGHFVRAHELSSSPLMYWHPPVQGKVPVCTSFLEQERVTKSRPLFDVYLYAVGGSNAQANSLSSAERYNLNQNRWEVVANTNTARHGATACFLGPNLYVAGGFDSEGSTSLASVERYNHIKNKWITVAEMNTERECAGTCVLGGRLYAIGGLGTRGNTMAFVERYDEKKNKWAGVRDMRTARWGLGACVLNGRVYAVGGCGKKRGKNLSSVERYDEERNVWEAAADMSTARWGVSACVLGRRLYAVGGCNGRGHALSSVERYDETRDRWEAVADMSTARYGAGAYVLDGRLYAVGGRDAHHKFLSSAERYDEEKDQWEAVPDMCTARWCAGICSSC